MFLTPKATTIFVSLQTGSINTCLFESSGWNPGPSFEYLHLRDYVYERVIGFGYYWDQDIIDTFALFLVDAHFLHPAVASALALFVHPDEFTFLNLKARSLLGNSFIVLRSCFV